MPPNMSLESYLLYGLGRGDVWLFIFVFLAVLWGLISLLTHRAEQRGMQKERDLWKKCKESSSTDQDYVSYLEKEKDRLEQRLEEVKNERENIRHELRKLQNITKETLIEYGRKRIFSELELRGYPLDAHVEVLKKQLCGEEMANENLRKEKMNFEARLAWMTNLYSEEKKKVPGLQTKVHELEQEIKRLGQKPSNSPTPPPPVPRPSPAHPRHRPFPTGRDYEKTKALPALLEREKKTLPLAGIDLFPEIERDPRFVQYSNDLSRSPNDGKCILCRESVGRGDILLTDGRVIHQKCFDQCFSKLDSLKSDNDADAFLKENPQDVFRAKWLCFYFPDYPPDWKSRKRTVIEKANYECEGCGESEDELHVHHKIPLGKGGSNSIENLKCLCRGCHEKIHGPFGIKGEKSPWQLRKEALGKTILIKEDVEFDYTSQEGEKTHRKITPLRFENRHGWLHVKGYCHLRNAERTFNIRRMRNLRVKDDDGTTITLYQMAPD